MDQKFYEAPELDIIDLETTATLLNMFNGADDPPIHDEVSPGDEYD